MWHSKISILFWSVQKSHLVTRDFLCFLLKNVGSCALFGKRGQVTIKCTFCVSPVQLLTTTAAVDQCTHLLSTVTLLRTFSFVTFSNFFKKYFLLNNILLCNTPNKMAKTFQKADFFVFYLFFGFRSCFHTFKHKLSRNVFKKCKILKFISGSTSNFFIFWIFKWNWIKCMLFRK